jgi:4-amino-4-deoxy-L-arabinose transferase-like glycosyltransferase
VKQPIESSPSYNRHIALVGLLALCFLIRLAAFLGSKNFAYDAVSRTAIAEEWSKDPFFIPSRQQNFSPQYSPLPIYLYGLGLKLVYNPQIVPRLISLFWGTLSLIPFYFLMEILYNSRRAQIASLFFCIYTLSVKSAVVVSSESVFCFFLLMAVWQLYAYKSHSKKLSLLLGIVFVNLTAMSRYNGWLYIPLLSLLLPENLGKISRREIGEVIVLIVGSLIFPLIWMISCWRVYGDFLYPIHFILMDHLRVIARVGPAWFSRTNQLYLLFFWPGVLIFSLTPPVALLAVMGIKKANKIRWGWHPFILAIVPLAFILFRVLISGTFFPMARFFTDSNIFLLGYAALGYEGIENFCQKKNKHCYPIFLGGLIIFSFLALVVVGLAEVPRISAKVSSVSPLVRLEFTQEQIVSYLEKHLTEKDKVVLDRYRDWSELEIVFYSGHPRSHFFTRWHRMSRLLNWIREMKPRYLITGPSGRAWNLVKDEKILARIGFKLMLVEEAEKQNVYRLDRT